MLGLCFDTFRMTPFGGRVRSKAVVVGIASIMPQLAAAQVVRGVVIERVSGARVPGVVVSVASFGDSLRPVEARHALTNARGEYAVALPRAGAYALSAKRIGVARFEAPVFEVRTGETKRIDIVLARFDYRLPVVRVAANNLCIPKQSQFRTIVALWDEVRTALLAAEVSREQHLISGWLTLYNRSLEPQSLRILQDQRSVAQGLYDRPMRSISGDSLAKVGFWRAQDADTLVFYGPDADALLSDAFQSGHCFELVTGSGRYRGMHGLEFRPRRGRNTGSIDGTIWIDAGNFELRFVEFRYANLITIPRNPHLGGEVHFLRHESGAWVVRRWFIRMPQFPEIEPVAVSRGGVVSTSRRAYVYRIIEEGGGLFTPGLQSWEKPGAIAGAVLDSTGRAPLLGSLVSLSGTPFAVAVDSSGAFRFDSIPPGAYTLLASHPDYAGLGQMVDDEPLTLAAGQVYRASLRAITTSQLLETLCGGARPDPDLATVRVLVTHMDSGGTLARLPVWLRWSGAIRKVPVTQAAQLPTFTNDGQDAGKQFSGVETMTDADGAAVFCGVPTYANLELLILRPDDDPSRPSGARVSRVTSFFLSPGEVTVRAVSVRPPR